MVFGANNVNGNTSWTQFCSTGSMPSTSLEIRFTGVPDDRRFLRVYFTVVLFTTKLPTRTTSVLMARIFASNTRDFKCRLLSLSIRSARYLAYSRLAAGVICSLISKRYSWSQVRTNFEACTCGPQNACD